MMPTRPTGFFSFLVGMGFSGLAARPGASHCTHVSQLELLVAVKTTDDCGRLCEAKQGSDTWRILRCLDQHALVMIPGAAPSVSVPHGRGCKYC